MKDKETILVTDDDLMIRRVLTVLLRNAGFNVIQAGDGDECLRLAYEQRPSLILLDIGMPHKDGWEVCQRLRELSDVPIVMLTVRSDVRDKVAGLNGGADDYITKPYDNDELIARIRSVLRRPRWNGRGSARNYDDGFLRVDWESHTCSVGGTASTLSPKEWRLLEYFLNNPNRVLPRETLLRYGWGNGYEKDYGILKVAIYSLRRKLHDPARRPRYIHTTREMGYLFATYPQVR